MARGVRVNYPYECKCGHKIDISKSLRDIDKSEYCIHCGEQMDRKIGRSNFYGQGVEDAAFDPVFGCVIKNSKHRRALAKANGWEEVGNTDMNKWHDEKQAEKQKETERYYDDVTTDRIVRGKYDS